jgi:hypothetical protein
MRQEITARIHRVKKSMRTRALIPFFISFFLLTSGTCSAFSKGLHKIDQVSISKDQRILKEKIDIDELNNISYTLRFTASQLSFSCAIRALKMAKEIRYTKGLAKAYLIIGIYYFSNQDLLPAIKYSLLSYELSKTISDYCDKSFHKKK